MNTTLPPAVEAFQSQLRKARSASNRIGWPGWFTRRFNGPLPRLRTASQEATYSDGGPMAQAIHEILHIESNSLINDKH